MRFHGAVIILSAKAAHSQPAQTRVCLQKLIGSSPTFQIIKLVGSRIATNMQPTFAAISQIQIMIYFVL
jgi:hypothetical protein